MHPLSAAEFTARMEQIAAQVAALAARPDDPGARLAAELLGAMQELHAAGLGRMLALVQAGGDPCRPLLEQFAQDDLVRSLLLYCGVHPVPLRVRLEETIANLRPLVESYGGRVSLEGIRAGQVTLRLAIDEGTGPSPAAMLKQILEQAILVTAPDADEIHFDQCPAGAGFQLPIISLA